VSLLQGFTRAEKLFDIWPLRYGDKAISKKQNASNRKRLAVGTTAVKNTTVVESIYLFFSSTANYTLPDHFFSCTPFVQQCKTF
jgi:hypothetical protein